MNDKKLTRIFTTKTPDKPGAFMRACKVIMDHNGNIVRVSYNKGVNLFIEVSATEDELRAIDKELVDISYVDDAPPEPIVLVMSVRITDVPGALYPVLKIIDKYNVNISYLNSSSDMKGYQDFNIGMVVDNPGISKKILDEVAELYGLDVQDYNGNDSELDNTVFYIRLANGIQKLFRFDDGKVMQFITEASKVSGKLTAKGEDPSKALENVRNIANYIAFNRDLNFRAKIQQMDVTADTTLHIIEPPCGSNMYILRNMDDLLFIDTGLGIYTDELLLELRELFPAFYSMNKTFLVTHADPDHCGLLSVFDDIRIIATEKTAERLYKRDDSYDDRRSPESLAYDSLARIVTDYIPPEEKYIERIGDKKDHEDLLKIKDMRFGDITLEIYEGNGGHMPGETIILCREPKMLFTGDIYVNSKHLTPEMEDFNRIMPFLQTHVDADPDRLSKERTQLGRLMDDIGRKGIIVCAGHGAVQKL